DRPSLLVLDGCEVHTPQIAEMVAELLGSCPQVRVLATSREGLRARGEHLVSIQPMPVPDGVQVGDVRDDGTWTSITLFVDRARTAVPDLRLGRDELAVAGRICQHLEGIPLALELAARQLRVLTLDDLLSR